MSREIEPPLPHSADHEARILGMILKGNRKAKLELDRLKLDDFRVVSNQKIFAALKALAADRKPTDFLAVEEELQRTGQLESVGGIAYIGGFSDAVGEGDVEFSVRVLKGHAVRRALIHAANKITQEAFEGVDSEEKVLDNAIERLSEIARGVEGDRDNGTSYRDAAAGLLLEFDSQEGVRIFTDIDELDRLIGGFRAGELVLFTAETGVGKTLLAQQTRRRSCRDGRHTLFCSGEMRAQHLVSREIATVAAVEHWKMRRPERFTPEDRQALVEAASHECAQCRIVDGELSMLRIRKIARQMKTDPGMDLVIVDYDELVEAPGKDEFDQQRYIVRAGKSLAMELDCPVIVISQLRKSLQGEDRNKPTLQRLYGSGAKAKHSSIVIYVDRPYVQKLAGDETEARIVVAKNRDGKVGAINARFNVKTLRFESASERPPEPRRSQRSFADGSESE
jgi:replicative DNA helicase